MDNHIKTFIEKMINETLPTSLIHRFKTAYQLWASGNDGKLDSENIRPLNENQAINQADISPTATDRGVNALKRCAILKLNGGLGTSMGLKDAKCALPLKHNLTILDVFLQSIIATNTQSVGGTIGSPPAI